MHGSGCAVTACAMVANYYGSPKNPGQLCRALSASGGFDSGGGLYWAKVPGAAGGTIYLIGMAYYGGAADLAQINRELDAGYPLVAEVTFFKWNSTHFVLLTGRDGGTYYINDPYDGQQTTINARYGNPAHAIHEIIIYHGRHTPVVPTPTRYQQTDSRLAYTGTWNAVSTSSASGGSFRYANSSGASVAIKFTGTYLAWIAKKSPVYGQAKVTLDGGTSKLVNLYSPSLVWQQKVWSTGTLPSGSHTVKIKWTGTKTAAASDTNINLDAVNILGTLVQAPAPVVPAPTLYDQTDPHLAYSGTWYTFSTTSAFGGSYARANTNGASVTIPFTGQSLDWIAMKGTTTGIADVSLDGGPAQIVNLANPVAIYKQKVWSSGPLRNGPHTVTISRDPASSAGKYITIDAVEVLGTLR